MDDRVCGPSWTGPTVSFVWLLPLAVLRATESGVDRRVFGTITVVLTLVTVASGLELRFLASEVPGLLALLLLRASQLSSPAQKRVIRVVRDAMDCGFSWPRCRASHSS